MIKKTSKYRGVHWHQGRDKWQASIGYEYKNLYIGIFENEEDARDAFLAKEKELYGRNFEPLEPIFDNASGIVKIPLSCGSGSKGIKNYGKYWTIVDIKDYDEVKKYNWHFTVVGYAATYIDGKSVFMHKLLTGFGECDHENTNKLDNRRSNLRDSTRVQNSANKMKGGGKSSKFKGVCWDKAKGKWKASIKASYKESHLGRFDNEIQAAEAYDSAARILHGEFGRYNFPKPCEQSALSVN